MRNCFTLGFDMWLIFGRRLTGNFSPKKNQIHFYNWPTLIRGGRGRRGGFSLKPFTIQQAESISTQSEMLYKANSFHLEVSQKREY